MSKPIKRTNHRKKINFNWSEISKVFKTTKISRPIKETGIKEKYRLITNRRDKIVSKNINTEK